MPLIPILCQLGCLIHTASQPLLSIWVSFSSKPFPSVGAFHFALDDGFLKAFLSYGVAEESKFSFSIFFKKASSLFSFVQTPTVFPSMTLAAAVKRSIYHKGIHHICQFCKGGPWFTSIRSNEEGCRWNHWKFEVLLCLLLSQLREEIFIKWRYDPRTYRTI